MFDDPNKELDTLQKQLLADEAWFEKELDSAKRMIDQNPRKPQRTTAVRTAQAPKSAPRQSKPAAPKAPAPKKKGVKKLLILAAVEILGILGLAAYWVTGILSPVFEDYTK